MLGHPCIHFIIKAAIKYTFGIHVHLGHLGYPPFPWAWVGCDINQCLGSVDIPPSDELAGN